MNAAKEISEYLTTGMHHSTKEGQQKIQEIVDKAVKEPADANQTPLDMRPAS